jgi:hypothetical protein
LGTTPGDVLFEEAFRRKFDWIVRVWHKLFQLVGFSCGKILELLFPESSYGCSKLGLVLCLVGLGRGRGFVQLREIAYFPEVVWAFFVYLLYMCKVHTLRKFS